MKFILENFEYIVIVILLILLIFVIRLIISHSVVKRFLLNKKYKIKSLIIYDVNTKSEKIQIRVFNQNINDVRITSLGFAYKNKNIDYYQKYLVDNNFSLDHKVSITSRGFIELNLDLLIFKNLIQDLNKGQKRVSEIQVYIIDSIGSMNKATVENLRSYIIKVNKEEIKSNKILIKKQKSKLREERKNKRKSKRDEKKELIRHKVNKLKLAIKKLFSKKD